MTKRTAIQRLQEEQGVWADRMFGGQTPDGKLAHLKKEVAELIENPYDRMEYADCFILLLDAYRKAGGSADDLVCAAFQKLEINKQRVWGQPNEDGSVEHIEDGSVEHISEHSDLSG